MFTNIPVKEVTFIMSENKKQVLYFLPNPVCVMNGKRKSNIVPGVSMPFIPKNVHTLYFHKDPKNPPTLPFELFSMHNSIKEEKGIGWTHEDGCLYYRGKNRSSGGCWILVEK